MAFFTQTEVDILSQKTIRMDFLVELQFTSQTAYFWNGEYPLSSGGQTWLPMHGIGSIEGLGTSSEAASEQVTLSMSGIPDDRIDILALALEQTPEANQQLVKIYVQFFDDDWQPVGNPILLWFGFMQPPKVSKTELDDFNASVQTITVNAENAFFNRSRPPYGRNTDRDQQRRYPGDKFFEFTPSLANKTVTYPDY